MRSPWDFVFAIAERTRQGERERDSPLKGATGQAKRHIAQATQILKSQPVMAHEAEDEPPERYF